MAGWKGRARGRASKEGWQSETRGRSLGGGEHWSGRGGLQGKRWQGQGDGGSTRVKQGVTDGQSLNAECRHLGGERRDKHRVIKNCEKTDSKM